jgi:superfamily II DNA or RNA helicase
MMGLFLVFCIRVSHDDELRWSWQYPFSTEQQAVLNELERLVNVQDEPVSGESWCPVIHRTLKSFVNCDDVKKMVAEVEWPLYRFLIAMSINSTADGFGEPDNIPHIVKKLVYCIRANIFEQARRISEHDEEYGDDDYLNERPTLDQGGGLFGLKKYIIDKGQTPFNAIRYIANVASDVASNDPKAGFVSWNINPAEPERYDVLSINNKSFRFGSFLKFVDELLTETDRLLFLDILGDVRLPDTDFTVYEPADSFNNRTYHSSAFTEPANVFINHKQDVINGWLGNRRKRGTMVRDVTDQGIKWKRSAVMGWLDKCLLYLQLLFVLLEVSWGGPARIAEMSVLRITNGQDERRNMYFDGSWIMFLFRYNKTRAILGRDRRIPRYPPPVVVKQLIYYFTLVRPAVSYFMKHFNLPGKKEIDEYLFVDHKVGRWTEQTMYRRFNQVTDKHGIGMITASVYRQAAQLIMDNLVKFKWELPDEDNVLDESFGHSGRQAIESYAVEIEGGDLVQKNDKAHFKIGGFKWHSIVIPNASRRGPLPKRGPDEVDTSSDNGESSSQRLATSRPHISTAALTVLPPLQPDMSEIMARSYLPSVKTIVNPNVEIKPETLVALRMLLNDPDARFKSSYQAKAVQLFLNRLTDLLIILPTGGGKSLTFEIAPILEAEGTTVLILPFVALMTEMRQRLKKVLPKFKAEQWHTGRRSDNGLPNILLVSIEEAVSMEFQSFIQLANVNQIVRRWVVDEFHVLITQSEFRPVFPRLVTTIRLIPVPFVGLSATIPESYVDLVRIMMSSITTTVVRSPTDRPNLRYRVYRLQKDTEEELDKELCRQIKGAWNVCTDEEETRFIVFTHTAAAADQFMQLVNEKSEELGMKAVAYHSRMDRDSKEKAYRKWKDGEAKLLVGTGAIGAGMDFAHVRRVWHRGFASSNINFIQEMGRAGRDGEPALCVLIYCSAVEEDCKRFIGAEYIAEHKSYIEEQGCLRAYLTEFVDGARIDCLSSSEAEMCMPCTSVMSKASLAVSVCAGGGNGPRYQGELNQLAFQDMMSERTELIEKVRRLMDAVEGVCGVCWFRHQAGKRGTDQPTDHGLARCRHMVGICLRCFTQGHATARCVDFPQPLRFKKGCCWTCGFPQYLFGERVHGDNAMGTCDRLGLRDKLAGIGWMSWRDPSWQGRVRNGFPELCTARDGVFMEWLGQVGKHGIINAVWLSLFFFQKSEEELDSLDVMHLDLEEEAFNTCI